MNYFVCRLLTEREWCGVVFVLCVRFVLWKSFFFNSI